MSRLAFCQFNRNLLLRGLLFANLLLALSGFSSSLAATPVSQLNAAGLVIRHGDGRTLYIYVQFSEPAISATDLLQRAGVSIDVTPFSGLGQGVCRIDGEGCPSTNCFCKSYANPSVYWRYERLSPDGSWISLPYAASQKSVHSGDVVGFSWSSKDGDLPSTSLAEIARMNGVTPVTATSSPSPMETVSATSTPSAPTPTAASAATPGVSGVEIDPSGTVTPVERTTGNGSSDRSSYAWFGAGIVVIALVGAVVTIRRRRDES